MALAILKEISKQFAGTSVLEGVSLEIDEGHRIGLVGPNGAGKTTLFRMLCKEEDPDAGDVFIARAAKIGFLRQSGAIEGDQTLFHSMLEPFAKLLKTKDALDGLADEMERAPDDPKLLAQYGDLHHEYEVEGGYHFEQEIKRVLFGLGFREEDLAKPVRVFSGGQKNRAAIARELLSGANLLLLDEPTNHLDIHATEWLEDYLRQWKGAAVIVSHDRYFLDQVVDEVAEMMNRRLTHYTGNYSSYVDQRDERRRVQAHEYEMQQKEIARTEEFIRRNLAGQKTNMAKGRRKMLERLERVERVTDDPKGPRIRILTGSQSGRVVVRCQGLGKAYGAKELFRGLDLEVERGDRLGLLGPNGAGKTTLLRVLLGEEAPSEGKSELGHNVKVAYYKQERTDLDPTKNVLATVWDEHPRVPEIDIRKHLAKFLFTGEDVFQKVATLSGGEQSRVALARLLLSKANLLVLDEPTNHLDIPAKEAIEEALQEYDGTILVVSHDRYFLDRVVTRLIFMEGGETRVVDGNYTTLHELQSKEVVERKAALPEKQDDYREQKRKRNEASKRQKRVKEVEAEIGFLEGAVAGLQKAMCDESLAFDWEKLGRLDHEKRDKQARLEKLMKEWETLSMSESAPS